ncbi:hypothetical protein NQ028_02525 [Corynebacterium phoceense]|uniref:hypothetical protein n=1 Tax=Corynebacterium phoceense TaxID=1686286 RepID=UPI00211BD7E4|nr:hypothetical protein [Corynebacterium phoceense]MCQ9340020.1 hypothetical protein [Corynebacterium phoceense]
MYSAGTADGSQSTTVLRVHVEGDPLAEAGRIAGAGDQSVTDGVDGLATGAAVESEVGAPMVSASTRAEAGRDDEPLGDWHCCHVPSFGHE